MYTEKQLAAIAKRENNNKRKYLVVNRLQGKHVPVKPAEAFKLFDELSEVTAAKYKGERLLLIGFAETATAIGAALAVNTDSYYMQTTRENIEGAGYLYFEESHSHATEQRIVKEDFEKIAEEIDRIVFVEDEVTTGNTIMHIIDIIKEMYPDRFKFAVASLLNGMDEAAMEKYAGLDIDISYVVKTDHELYTAIAEGYKGDGIYHECDMAECEDAYKSFKAGSYVNTRRLTKGSDYLAACEGLWKKISSIVTGIQTAAFKGKRVLVLGTEEFMYPALFISRKFEENGADVRCHSTTRSPIAVSSEEEYPLHERFTLKSLYDEERRTFIYDIGCYDEVFVITDAAETGKGKNSLINAIISKGNNNIKLVYWG